MPWHRRQKVAEQTVCSSVDNTRNRADRIPAVTHPPKSHFVPRLILFFGGVFVILFTIGIQDTESEVVDWPRVEATVLKSALEEIRETDRPDLFRLKVSFDYMVDTRTYKSDQLAPFGFQANSLLVATRELEKYAPGTIHQAYVNPDDPSKAYLTVYGSRLTYNIFIGIGMVMIGLASAIGLFRKAR